jgi:hypothetical protein
MGGGRLVLGGLLEADGFGVALGQLLGRLLLDQGGFDRQSRVPRLMDLRARFSRAFPFRGGLLVHGGRVGHLGSVGVRGGAVPGSLGALGLLLCPLLADLKDLVEELVELPHRYSPSLSM